MKLLNRNLKTISFSLYDSKVSIVDENGYETGEYKTAYKPPVMIKCSVSPATGNAQTEMFGNLESYDKVLITADTNCPIDENTILFVDKEVEFTEDGKPLGDYIVKRVAKSLNSIAYAISKVNVS